MATSADLLLDSLDRVRETVVATLDGLGTEELATRVGPGANSIAWLVWHLTRVMDDHVADAAGAEQRWSADGWADRLALPFEIEATGYGQTSDEVASVRVAGDLLVAYHEAVQRHVGDYVRGLTDADLDRVVDARWDPPVTLGVRLVSVVNDATQHAGQAAFVRGLLG